jgi:hypothetical protein
MPLPLSLARNCFGLARLATPDAGNCWVVHLSVACHSVARNAEPGCLFADISIRAAGPGRVQRRSAADRAVDAAGRSPAAERRIGRAVPAQVRTVAAIAAVSRADTAGRAGGVTATDRGTALAWPVGVAFRVVAQAAIFTTPPVAVRVLPAKTLRFPLLDLLGNAVLLVVVWTVTEFPPTPATTPTIPVAVAIPPVPVLCVRFILGQGDSEETGRRPCYRDLERVTARRCLRQRFGEEIEPSSIHVRHSSWRLEPLPSIITGTLLAYAVSTTRKRETGTSGFLYSGAGRSQCGGFRPGRYEISKIVSISTGTFPGRACRPTADRACTPRSPKTSCMNSEKP